MSELELRDEVMTIFLAGHETTANALAWTWHLLGENPRIEAALHAEVDAVLGGRTPCLADIERLEYTRMVIEESLRLRPPVWAIGRLPTKDDSVGGYHLPAYTSVILSPYVTHRHPAFWPEPERFDPERFRPAEVTKRPRYAYFPFGGGPRQCIGREFAMMEAVLVLASLSREFSLRPSSDHTVAPEPMITLRPLGGLSMRLQRRR
jgi:cytochrome P450